MIKSWRALLATCVFGLVPACTLSSHIDLPGVDEGGGSPATGGSSASGGSPFSGGGGPSTGGKLSTGGSPFSSGGGPSSGGSPHGFAGETGEGGEGGAAGASREFVTDDGTPEERP